MNRRVLVAYASRHGATQGVAERIATTLRASDVDATAVPAELARKVDGYDGYVIGSAVYAAHWLDEAKAFLRLHRGVLARRPVWLFSCGPLGPALTGPESAARDIDDLERGVGTREHWIFGGAWSRANHPIGVLETVMHAFPAARQALPEGDFRDWREVDQFARTIAGELELALATP